MGMFDSIVPSEEHVPCPKCGAHLSGFQSKDGPCELKELKPYEVDNFYTGCSECGTWVEFDKVDLDYYVFDGVVFKVSMPHEEEKQENENAN